jgi:hypothetical protein
MSKNKIFIGLFFIFFILTLTFIAQAEEVDSNFDSAELQPDNLLFLELRLGDLELRGEYLASYNQDDVVLIPAGELLQFLELPFSVNTETGIIEGFIWNEENKYRLDVFSGTGENDQGIFEINGHRTAVNGEDIYLDVDLISEWLPLTASVNPFSAVLSINSDRPLPLEERVQRRYRWDRLSQRKSFDDQPLYPVVENPYQLFSGPFVDFRYYYSDSKDGDSSSRHNTRLSGDLFYMSGRLNISGPIDDPFDDVSGRLGRRSPDPDLLGPFKAYEFWLGDLNQPGVNDISSWESVEGISINGFPYTRARDFYSHTLEGELPEGWEVELYDNGTLIDFQRADEEERYIFDNIPINYGVNEFTLVFYDEFGQRYEEIKRLRIDSSLIPPGENRYRIDIGRDDQDENRISLEYNRGLNENLSLVTNYVNLPLEGSSEDYGRIGLRGSIDNLFWEGNYLQQFGEGQAGELGFYTSLGDTNISLKHAEFDNYQSEEISNLKRRTELELRRSFRLPVVDNLSTRLELSRNRYEDDKLVTEIYNYLSTYYKDFSFRNTINADLEEDGTSGSGKFWVYRYLGRYWLRGELGYEIAPYDAQNIAAELQGRIDDDHRFNLRLDHDLEDDYNTYSTSITRDKDSYRLGLNASYKDNDDSWELGFNFSTSFGWTGEEKGFESGTSARYGAVSVNTYLDLGEEKRPIEGVGYKINGRTNTARTDENGSAVIKDIFADHKTDIAIDPETLEDPFLILDPEGVSFIPRPGKTFQLDLPVVMTGEIGGYVYLEQEGENRGLSGVSIQLLDENEEIIRTTATAYDGYFYIPELKPGSYLLRISPESIERRGLNKAELIEVELPVEGGYIAGFEWILDREE